MNSFLLLLVLHKLLALAFLLGLLFFIVWALRTLKKDQLKKWALALLVVGLVGCVLTVSFGGGFGHGKKFKKGYGKMHTGVWTCMKDEECNAEMESMMERMGME